MCVDNQHGGTDIQLAFGGPHCPRFITRHSINRSVYRVTVIADLTPLPLTQYACLFVGAGDGQDSGLLLAISRTRSRILNASAINDGVTDSATIHTITETDLNAITKCPVVELTITRLDNLFFFSINGVEIYAYPVTPDLQTEEIFGVLLIGAPQPAYPVNVIDLCVQLPA